MEEDNKKSKHGVASREDVVPRRWQCLPDQSESYSQRHRTTDRTGAQSEALDIVNLLDTRTVCQSCRMDTPLTTAKYKNHRFPVEIISHGVWLYFRFCLSFRDIEELLVERGVVVTYEAIRKWCRKFGQQYATQLRRRRPRPGDKWHLDEVFLTIKGKHHYLWRAVDQEGNVLDILVQRRRDKKAAKNSSANCLRG